jgi:exodeoxyribonuclease V gamma subunit
MMHLYSAGRADHLAARLAEVLSESPLDPMEAEWVGVSSQGMRRWLMLELARHIGSADPTVDDGVAANFSMPFPDSLRVQVLEAGRAEGDPDPWRIERLAWAVLSVAEANCGDAVLDEFNALPEGVSRYGKARRAADLFDHYHVHRSHMVQAWAKGRDVGSSGREIPPHHAWQPYLWRLVRDHIGEPSPPERWPDLLAALASGELAIDLPERITLFGLTSLPGGQSLLDLCTALAVDRQVHLFLLEPTHFDPLSLPELSASALSDGQRLRAEDTSADSARHPLLRSWGRPHREASLILNDTLGVGLSGLEIVEDPTTGAPPDTTLARLQRDIAANREPSDSIEWDLSDRSLQLHSCHGETRQVEVLRDVILHLLADQGSDLTEDDVLVVCPALDRFAPMVEAVFGPSADTDAASAADELGSPLLRYRIADRSLSDANPVLSSMTSLMELVRGRFDATSVLDFISLAPVRFRFGFDDDDLATIDEWVGRAEVRWGLTPDHRSAFGVPATIVTNTWRSALDRLLLGSAVSDDMEGLAIGDVAVIGVEGSKTQTLGRLAELLWQLSELAEAFSRDHPLSDWMILLRQGAAGLFATPPHLSWQSVALSRILADVEANASSGAHVSDVSLNAIDVRRILGDLLGAAEGRPDFFRGGVTITSLKPLRGIPYRVVCLLGADETAFSAGSADGDDLAAFTPLVGDPDKRSDDRQSLLEAVLAAADKVIVVRNGHDIRTNQIIPRAVVLEELCDAIRATVDPARRDAFLNQLEVCHPRQAFDDRCFEVGELIPDAPWGFGEHDRLGAQARRLRARELPPFMSAPLTAHDQNVVDLADVHAFLKHPVAWFVAQRLQARLYRSPEARKTQLPVAPDALERWHLGDGLLSARRAGLSTEQWVRIERQRGTIPPGSIGAEVIADVSLAVDQLLQAANTLGVAPGDGTDIPIDLAIPGGTRLVGNVRTHLLAPLTGPLVVTYSKSKAERQVAAWLDLMALAANYHDEDWRSVVVTRTDRDPPVSVVTLTPQADTPDARAAAIRALEVVIDCYRRGSVEPIPLFPSLSEKIHRNVAKPKDWQGGNFMSSERDNPSAALVYGDCDFEELMAIPPEPGDPPGTGGRVRRFADYLYGAMDTSVKVDEVLQ